MIVFSALLIFGMFGFFIPKDLLLRYMIFAIVCISGLLFFFNPPVEYDLYRHYEALQAVRKIDLWTLLFGDLKTTNRLIAIYREESLIYLIYLYFIGLLQNDGFLPVITGIIIYGCAAKLIALTSKDLGDEVDDWKLAFCFLFFLFINDFRSVTGIRNMLSFTLFAYILYFDLVKKKNPILCWISYALLLGIHSGVIILIAVRLMVMLKKIPLWMKALAAFLVFIFIDILLTILLRFNQYSIAVILSEKLKSYFMEGGSTYQIKRVAIFTSVSITYLALYLYLKRHQFLPHAFEAYTDYFVLAVFIGLGAFRQYDTYVRMHLFYAPAAFPVLLSFIHQTTGKTPMQLLVANYTDSGIIELGLCMLICVVMFLFEYMYLSSFYTPMDPFFSFYALIFK